MKRIFIYIGLLISLTAWSQSQASLQKQTYWEDFRNALPNPYRTIGFAAFDDHSQLYIISEPPKDITLDQIEEVFGFLLYDIETKKWDYGFDGWVKDVVVTVEHAPDSCQTEIIRQLNELLYGNAEQTIYQPLPFARKRKLYLDETLDVHINASSLYGWFVEDDMPVEDFMGNKTTFTGICSRAKNAVYRSSEPGFILWTLPKNGTIKVNDRNFRRFTINSDIILGAVSSYNTVCIIARERETDLLDVPPLRSDEVAMLAWAPNKLSQSLDVGGFLTGKMSDNYDWCPAYLSDELNNTEIGHLLTLTDVFMKDWLRGATYEYKQYKYPKPDVRFTGDLGNQKGTRFNWNTDGLYSKVNFSPYSVFTIRNTGCLNCSLFDNTEVDEVPLMDKHANAYLASVNNVDLFRVAQYFALYQIFKEYGISCPSYKSQHGVGKANLLTADARRSLNKIRNLTEAEKERIVLQVTEDEFTDVKEAGFNSAFEQTKADERKKWDERFTEAATQSAKNQGMSWAQYMRTAEYKTAKSKYEQAFNTHISDLYAKSRSAFIQKSTKYAREEIDELLIAARSIPERDIDGFCRYCSCPHTPINARDYRKYSEYEHNLSHSWSIWKYGELLGIDYKDIMSRYRNALVKDTSVWHKCPKIFITNNLVGSMKGADGKYRPGCMVGGHSIKQNVHEETRRIEPRQEKSSVSHYYSAPAPSSSYSDGQDLLAEIEYEAKKSEEYARRDPIRGALNDDSRRHQRNALNLMSSPIKGKHKSRTTEVKFYGLEEAFRKAEQEHRVKREQERKEQKVKEHIRAVRKTEELQGKCDRILNQLTATSESRQANAAQIQQLEKQRRFLERVPEKYLPENVSRRAAEKVQELREELPVPAKVAQEEMEDAELRRLRQQLAELDAIYNDLLGEETPPDNAQKK